MISEADKKKADQALMRYCLWCRRFTAQVPVSNKKRPWKCLRCKAKLEEVGDERGKTKDGRDAIKRGG